MSAFVSRGFQRRHRPPDELAERLPPGQYLEYRWRSEAGVLLAALSKSQVRGI
jgi:hypothetical protein